METQIRFNLIQLLGFYKWYFKSIHGIIEKNKQIRMKTHHTYIFFTFFFILISFSKAQAEYEFKNFYKNGNLCYVNEILKSQNRIATSKLLYLFKKHPGMKIIRWFFK